MAELDNIYATEDDTEESGGLPPEIAALFASTSSELEGNLAEGPLDETEEARVPFWASGHAKLNMDKKLGLDKKESYLTSVESAKEGDTAGAAAAKLIETGADEQAQTRSQAIAQALIAITPMLIGAAIKGKKGAAVGAAAGGAGVGLMEQQRLLREKEQREEQRDLKKLGIQQQGQLAKSLISQAGQEARSDKAFERAKELIQFRKQIEGAKGENDAPASAVEIKALTPGLLAMGFTEDEISSLTSSQVKAVKGATDLTLDVTDTLRRYDQEFQLPSRVKSELAGLGGTVKTLDSYLVRLDTILQEQDPGFLSTPIDKFMRSFPQFKLGEIEDDLKILAVTARGAKEPGPMTEQDYQRWRDYIGIREGDTVESVMRRLNQVKTEARYQVKSFLEVERAAGKVTDPVEAIWGFDLSYVKPMTASRRPSSMGGGSNEAESRRERYERLKVKYGK